jgi:hypothetical protein
MPSLAEEDFTYSTTPVYFVQSPYAPEAGRNIFAFYEPPPPTPYSPTPIPSPTPFDVKTPTPTPTPPFMLFAANVPNGIVYAGQDGFQMEINGDKFTPDSQITINGAAFPTTYYSPQRLSVNIPRDLVRNPATLFIAVITPGGLYSNQISLTIQPQPKPQFEFVGVEIKSGNNNNTAYIKEGTNLTTKRLNDKVGRFEIVSISKENLIVRDTSLGFRHQVDISRGTGGQGSTTTTPSRITTTRNPMEVNPTNPTVSNPTVNNTNCPPGIPCNLYPPSNTNTFPQQQRRQTKDEDDDDGDGNK